MLKICKSNLFIDFAEILEEINNEEVHVKNSDKPISKDLNIIDEDDDENELTGEIDRTKLNLLTNNFNVTRKDRAATFKPFNYIKDQTEVREKEDVLKNVKAEITQEEKKVTNFLKDKIVKQRGKPQSHLSR